MMKQIVCPDCGGYGFVRTECTANSVSAKTCPACKGVGLRDAPMTNADRIRAMSDEELACLLAHETYRNAQPLFEIMGYGITEEFLVCLRLKWLKQPAEVK